MGIIFKFLLRNILQNKIRTFLIVFSILLSTALLFSTLSISKTMQSMYLKQMLKNSGSAEVVVYPNTQSLSAPFFEPFDISHLEEKIDYKIYATKANTTIKDKGDKDVFVSLLGLSVSDLELLHNSKLVRSLDNQEFTDNMIIIGKADAFVLGIDIGDKMSLYLNNQNYEFLVYAIAEDRDFFDYSGLSINLVVPTNTIASIYGYDGLFNLLLFKTTAQYQPNDLIKDLFEIYNGFVVEATISDDLINENLNTIIIPFSLMLVLVMFISIFIINTSFKVITYERLPIVGTFRSIGATKKATNTILLGESIIFGILGGLFGILLGIGILQVMMNSLSTSLYSDTPLSGKMVIEVIDVLLAFFAAVILSIIGAVLPILKTSKVSVKDILLNNFTKHKKPTLVKPIIGLSLIVITIISIRVFNDIQNIAIGAGLMVMLVIGIIFIIPLLTRGSVFILAKTNKFFFGNIGELSAKNLKNAKNVVNNITLIVIGIASIIMINTVSLSVLEAIGTTYDQADFELTFSHINNDQEVIERLKNVEGVESVYSLYSINNIRYIEKSETIQSIEGINPDIYFDYWQVKLVGDADDLKEELVKGRNIIPSVILKNRFNLHVGDYMTLEILGNQIAYQIIGFMETLVNNGNYILMSEQILNEDIQLSNYALSFVRINQNELKVINQIEAEFDKEIFQIISMNEQKAQNEKANSQVFDLFIGFSIITLVIGSFGVFNNFVVSYLNRKQSIAVYRSIGMSKKQSFYMMLIEAVNTGLIGGVLAVIASFIFIDLAGYVLKSMNLPITMIYDNKLFIFGIFSAILIAVISGLSPIFKSSRMNIVQEIKFE